MPPPNDPTPDSKPSQDDKILLEIATGRSVDPFQCLSRAWTFFCVNPWPIIGAVALMIVIVVTATGIPGGFIINGPCLGGLYLYLLRQLRGEPVEFGDIFLGFKRNFLQLLIASTISGLLEIAGFTLLIVPGLYLLLIWTFSFQLIIDRGFDFWPGMELSRKTVHAHFAPMLTLFLLNIGINLLGALLCGIGLLITLPITILATLYAYEDLFKQAQTTDPTDH